MNTLIVDCGSCELRGAACSDCVINVLLEPHEHAPHHFDADEQQAMAVLAQSGLVPPLRLVVSDSEQRPGVDRRHRAG